MINATAMIMCDFTIAMVVVRLCGIVQAETLLIHVCIRNLGREIHLSLYLQDVQLLLYCDYTLGYDLLVQMISARALHHYPLIRNKLNACIGVGGLFHDDNHESATCSLSFSPGKFISNDEGFSWELMHHFGRGFWE